MVNKYSEHSKANENFTENHNRNMHWIRGCAGKKRYREEKTAIEAKEKSEKERPVTLRIYRCVQCFGWHLTSKKNKDSDYD